MASTGKQPGPQDQGPPDVPEKVKAQVVLSVRRCLNRCRHPRKNQAQESLGVN